jgi:hypothetical protein
VTGYKPSLLDVKNPNVKQKTAQIHFRVGHNRNDGHTMPTLLFKTSG